MEESIVTNDALASERLLQVLAEVLAVHSAPQEAADWFALGAQLHALQHPVPALAAFESGVAIDPSVIEGWMAVATLRAELGRPLAAEQACRHALSRNPDALSALMNLALLRQGQGDLTEALSLIDQAVALEPRNYAVRKMAGGVLAAAQRLDEGAELMRACLREQPEDTDVLYALADIELARSRFADAGEGFERLLRRCPEHTGGQIGLAVAFALTGRENEADALLQHVMRNDPLGCAQWKPFIAADLLEGRAQLDVNRFRIAVESAAVLQCNWSRRSGFVRWLAGKCQADAVRPVDDPDAAFLSLTLEVSPADRLQLARRTAQRLRRAAGDSRLVRIEPRASARLRIGYLSGDLLEHPIGRLLSPVFRLHDREKFEVFVYHSGPKENSVPRCRAEQGCDVFRDIPDLPFSALAQMIAMDGIDILVDLSGYTMHGRTAALSLRPSPIQISYMGYLGTLGADYVDYALVDRYSLLPEARPYWTEALAYLPHTFFMSDDDLSPQMMLGRGGERARHGLPEQGCVLACLNSSWKIEPSIFALWMRVLQAVPESVLWLYDGGVAQTRQVFAAEARAHGVSATRLIFAPRVSYPDYLARYASIDLVLNTEIYAGNTTTMEALAMGVPVLALAGDTLASRAAAGMLVAHGLPECIAHTPAEYLQKAIQLASDRQARTLLKEKTLACRSTSGLFRREARVREIECAYLMMWERRQAGLAPADFDVPPVS